MAGYKPKVLIPSLAFHRKYTQPLKIPDRNKVTSPNPMFSTMVDLANLFAMLLAFIPDQTWWPNMGCGVTASNIEDEFANSAMVENIGFGFVTSFPSGIARLV